MGGLSFYHWLSVLAVVLLTLAVPLTQLGVVIWYVRRQQ